MTSRLLKPIVTQGVSTGTSAATSTTGDLRPADMAAATRTEIIASTPEDWAGFKVQLLSDPARTAIFSVYTGPSGSETRIATFCNHHTVTTISSGLDMEIDIPIPKGTRISLAIGGASTYTGNVSIVPKPAANHSTLTGLTRLDSGPYNLDGGSADWGDGCPVDTAGTVNTKGSWTEISLSGTNSIANNEINPQSGAGLPEAYKYLAVVNMRPESSADDRNWLVDLGYGTDGTNWTTFVENWHHITTLSEQSKMGLIWVPWGKPAGTRVAVRTQADEVTDTVDRLGNYVIYGYL